MMHEDLCELSMCVAITLHLNIFIDYPIFAGHSVSVVISIRFRARAIFPGRRLPNACLAQPVHGRAEIPFQSLFTLEVTIL